jgi:hypothetical protein
MLCHKMIIYEYIPWYTGIFWYIPVMARYILVYTIVCNILVHHRYKLVYPNISHMIQPDNYKSLSDSVTWESDETAYSHHDMRYHAIGYGLDLLKCYLIWLARAEKSGSLLSCALHMRKHLERSRSYPMAWYRISHMRVCCFIWQTGVALDHHMPSFNIAWHHMPAYASIWHHMTSDDIIWDGIVVYWFSIQCIQEYTTIS